MRDLNKIILIGRLGTDPVQRETKNGLAVVHFPLATASGRVEQAEEGQEPVRREETTWHRIVVWGKQAENCKQFLAKGEPVYIEGAMRSRKYTGKDGQERVAFEVHADNVGFLGGRRRPQSQEGGASATEVEIAVSA